MKIRNILPQIVKGYLFQLEGEFNFVNPNFEKGLEVRILDEADCYVLLNLRNENVRVAFERMIQEGQICVGAYIEGALIAHAACVLPVKCQGAFKIIESAYIHYCYVDPKWRGQGIYPHMLSVIIQNVFEEHNVKKVSITTSQGNISSQRGLSKVGFRFVKRYVYVEWWRILWKKIKI